MLSSARKLTEVFSRRSDVCGMSGALRREAAKVDQFIIDPNRREPWIFSAFFLRINPFVFRLTALPPAAIAGVLLLRRQAKIIKSVIGAFAIFVINPFSRPASRDDKPREVVDFVSLAINHYPEIAIRSLGAGYIARPKTPGSFTPHSPEKYPGLRVVIQNFVESMKTYHPVTVLHVCAGGTHG